MDAMLPLLLPCHSQDSAISAIESKIGERLAATGVTVFGEQFRIYSNTETGTFSVLVITPDKKMACMMSAGTDYETLKQGDDL